MEILIAAAVLVLVLAFCFGIKAVCRKLLSKTRKEK